MDLKASPTKEYRPLTERRVNSLRKRREQQDWPATRKFKILSLDGGGIRGIYAAQILAELEGSLPPDRMIADYFDMVAGTSTGGIIAIGIGLRIPAKEILRLYLEDGKDIFPTFWTRHPILAFLKRMFGPLYDYRKLEKHLKAAFKDATLGDSHSRLVIPAFLGPKTQIAVLKTDHHADFKCDWKMPAWQAARATSAAPTFLAGHAGDDFVFLDGGIWANNPIMAAVVDALSAYKLGRDQIEVLSIGTGNAPFDLGRFAARGGLFRWKEIITGAMFLTTDNADAQAGLLIGPENIRRLSPIGKNAEIDLGDWQSARDHLPKAALSDLSEARESVSMFFESPVLPRERHYSRK